jgi:predicted DNA-binding transcriptional regulator AlpA
MRILTLDEVAARLGKNRRSVYRLINRTYDPLPAKDAGELVVVEELFERWMRNELDPTATPKSVATRHGSVRSVAETRRKTTKRG